MNSVTLSCSGKFFVLGEYACLAGGQALISNVEPGFELTVQKEKTPEALSFDEFLAKVNEFSPSGKLLLQNKSSFNGLSFTWKEPHQVQAGVGSSSAQFFLLFHFLENTKNAGATMDASLADKCLKLYWQLSESRDSLLPSGTDLVMQALGGPCVVQTKPALYHEKLSAFSDKARLILAFTGTKKKTYSLLKALKEQKFPNGFDLSELGSLTTSGIDAWKKGDVKKLGKVLSHYQEALFALGLADQPFTNLARWAQKVPGVYGCKGAGAQGGDCLVLLIDPNHSASIHAALTARNLTILTEM